MRGRRAISVCSLLAALSDILLIILFPPVKLRLCFQFWAYF